MGLFDGGKETWYFVEKIITNEFKLEDQAYLLRFENKKEAKNKQKYFKKLRKIRKDIIKETRKKKFNKATKKETKFSDIFRKYEQVRGINEIRNVLSGEFRVGDIIKRKNLDKLAYTEVSHMQQPSQYQQGQQYRSGTVSGNTSTPFPPKKMS